MKPSNSRGWLACPNGVFLNTCRLVQWRRRSSPLPLSPTAAATRQTATRARPEWEDYFADAPYVKFQFVDANSDAISAADVAAVGNYIWPGGAWK